MDRKIGSAPAAFHGNDVELSNGSMFTPVKGEKIYMVNDH
jgi:hypothetical protein